VRNFNPELWSIVGLTLRVTGTALLISTLVGVPLGARELIAKTKYGQALFTPGGDAK
jgi:hypothetical protein